MDIIRITDISSDGEGIGRTEGGMVVFVPGALPGDTVEAEILLKEGSRSAKGVLLRIAEPSPDRIEPACPYSAECGGCPIIGLNYKAQLMLKQKHVEDALLLHKNLLQTQGDHHEQSA